MLSAQPEHRRRAATEPAPSAAHGLGFKTVHNLHYQIKAKLGTNSDFELARLVWQNGWLN